MLSPQQASIAAQAYLNAPPSEREKSEILLENPDVLISVLSSLKHEVNATPANVLSVASEIYRRIEGNAGFEGLFDERHYFIGEVALLASSASRVLGRWDETESWLVRAEAGFRHTVKPGPGLACVSYVRIALFYDKGRFAEVVQLATSLISSFRQFGMARDEAKARLLKASALKLSGDLQRAMLDLRDLSDHLAVRSDQELLGRVLIDIGDIHQIQGDVGKALAAFQSAAVLLQNRVTGALGDLKLDIGALLRNEGHQSKAVHAFREAREVYQSLGMVTRAAYVHVLTAETLLALGRPREAEWEILAALPTIEQQGMVPEGFAAVALLKESVLSRKADPNALRELRERLQAKR